MNMNDLQMTAEWQQPASTCMQLRVAKINAATALAQLRESKWRLIVMGWRKVRAGARCGPVDGAGSLHWCRPQ